MGRLVFQEGHAPVLHFGSYECSWLATVPLWFTLLMGSPASFHVVFLLSVCLFLSLNVSLPLFFLCVCVCVYLCSCVLRTYAYNVWRPAALAVLQGLSPCLLNIGSLIGLDLPR